MRHRTFGPGWIGGTRRAGRWLAGLAIVLSAGWGTLFLRYRTPGGALAAAAADALFGALAIAAIVGLVRWRWAWPAGYAAAFVGLLVWFNALVPRNDRDWAVDVSRPLTAQIGPDQVTVNDVRDFDWRSNEDFTPRWHPETYRLADLRTVDLITSYWSGTTIAHVLLSFGFADGRHLVFSIEIRREKDEEYSDLAGFFKEYELVFVAAEERDIIRLRTNVRGEDVQLYRIRAEPDQVRGVFVELLRRANRVAAHPVWYNSLNDNCTTEMFGAARSVAPDLPFSWRVILSGYLPGYAYDQGLLDRSRPFSELRHGSHIRDAALAAGDGPDFSARIRAGVP